MSGQEFLRSSPRQIKTLYKFHRNFYKGILIEAAGDLIESIGPSNKEEYIEIESLSDI